MIRALLIVLGCLAFSTLAGFFIGAVLALNDCERDSYEPKN